RCSHIVVITMFWVYCQTCATVGHRREQPHCRGPRTGGYRQMQRHRDSERQIFLRPIEAAAALGCSRTRVYELVRTGELPHILLGGTSIRIPRQAITEMVAQAMGRETER